MDSAILHTTYISIAIQVLMGAVGAYGLTQKVAPEHRALQTSLHIEMAVQVIELGFYVWLVTRFSVATMASVRYYDWVLSTPLMLLSLMIYFKYEEYRERGLDSSTIVWRDFLHDNRAAIAQVLGANLIMILFGYLGEIGTLQRAVATLGGFGAFAAAFYTMYAHFASTSVVGTQLFSVNAVIWGLYGVAYIFPDAPKNIALNALDVVAKNIFGLYLAHKVIQTTPSTT